MTARDGVMFALLVAAGACGRAREVETGRRLFHGDRALMARLAGDDLVLPATASRCANCHVGPEDPPPDAVAKKEEETRRFGPALAPAALRLSRRRHGGPPSRYDEASFCTLLRTGVDPVHVLIKRAMPRYELDATACRALWTYLTEGS